MSCLKNKLLPFLRKNIWALAAFLIPLGIRSIPEILSWPYLLGLDTLNGAPIIQSGWVFSLGAVGFLHVTSMFYFFAGLLYGLTGNVVFVLKFLGPILLAVLCGMMFFYARRGLGWSNPKSLLVAILIATYFVSLRNSWDLYRQTLGLIFLIAAIISLKSLRSPTKYYVAGGLMILTVLSHELATVILFFILLVWAVQLLVKKSFKQVTYLGGSAILAVALFVFQRFSLSAGAFHFPRSSIASSSGSLALFMAGLLVYCYIILIPLVFVGLWRFKASAMHYWALLAIAIVILEMFDPNLPFYFWNRWVYLLVYPLLFFAVNGLDNIWKLSVRFKGKIVKLLPKVFAGTFVVLLLTLSGYYLTTSPENAFPYFSQYNPYLAYIPSSMLQNSLSISDNQAIYHCIQWLNENTSENSLIVTHFLLVEFMNLYLSNRNVTSVGENTATPSPYNETVISDLMVQASQHALGSNYSHVYTVWWNNGRGWYGIPSLPSSFQEIYASGDMAVYAYTPID